MRIASGHLCLSRSGASTHELVLESGAVAYSLKCVLLQSSLWLVVLALAAHASLLSPSNHIQSGVPLVASVLSDVRCDGSRVSGVVAQDRSHSGCNLTIADMGLDWNVRYRLAE